MNLRFIERQHVLKAIQTFDFGIGIPSNTVYWVFHENEYYPFKQLVALAGRKAGNVSFLADNFHSDDPERKYIASLVFTVRYFDKRHETKARYWAGAYYWGDNDEFKKLKDFKKDGWWGSDYKSDDPDAKRVYGLINEMQVNDRLVLRTIDRRNSVIKIEAIGTISNTAKAKSEGWVKVVWDLNPQILYEGSMPKGKGALCEPPRFFVQPCVTTFIPAVQ